VNLLPDFGGEILDFGESRLDFQADPGIQALAQQPLPGIRAVLFLEVCYWLE